MSWWRLVKLLWHYLGENFINRSAENKQIAIKSQVNFFRDEPGSGEKGPGASCHNGPREGHCWQIAEIHRQIKSDFQSGPICLQCNDALTSLNARLWTAVSFLYNCLDKLTIAIMLQVEWALKSRKQGADIIRLVYYKLAYAIKKLLAGLIDILLR